MKALVPAIFLFLTLPAALSAQGAPPPLSTGEKTEVVTSAASLLEKKYVFPEVAKAMGDLIRKNLEAGKYRSLSGPEEFAQALTDDLRSISRDQHLAVRYGPERIHAMKAQDEKAKKEFEERQRRAGRANNYGFREVKILPGNVGYLRFDGFNPSEEAMRVGVGAMAFLANTDALIVDLRQNGGGSPAMIQLLSSYFFAEPQHLNSFYYRENEKTEQFWTLPYVPGSKLIGAEVFVLTSNRTFSGAEEFTYNLKNLKRATIVGETTGGGAHPVNMEIINDSFGIGIPFARAVNPVTKTNWEGTGVEPDVKVPAEKALSTAQVMALEKLAGKEKDETLKAGYHWTLEGLKSTLTPVVVETALLESYVGTYGPRKVTLAGGALYYRRENGPKTKLIPMASDTFRLEEIDDFRLKVLKQGDAVTGVEGRYRDGRTDFSKKTE